MNTGLSTQVGFGQESTWGTVATIDHFYEHDDCDFNLDPNWVRGSGLFAGGQVQRASRATMVTRAAKGTFKADVTNKRFGLLFRHAIGSPVTTPTQQAATAAYKQVHRLGDAANLGLTAQVGKPGANGTVEPFTYPGGKVAEWTLSASQDQALKLELGLDFKDELTTATNPAGPALTGASYTTPSSLFHWTQAAIKIGGTASTASNVCSIAGGAAVTTLLKGFSLKGTTPLADDRFGPSATKSQQLQNGFTKPILSLDAEFNARAEFYDVYRAGTITPVQITFTGALIASTYYDTVELILPGAKIITNPVTPNGTDITNQAIEFECFADDLGNTPVQITYMSTDTTI